MTLKSELKRLGLLVEDVHLGPGHQTLLVLCNDGLLDGGMSVALDLKPDELIGPLCERIGGKARTLKVLDARDDPEPELLVDAGDGEEAWPIRDPPGPGRSLQRGIPVRPRGPPGGGARRVGGHAAAVVRSQGRAAVTAPRAVLPGREPFPALGPPPAS